MTSPSAAATVNALPINLDMPEESGTRGGDYDIAVWLQPDRWIAVEIKTRAQHGPYSEKVLNRILDRARSQLPVQGPGAIFSRSQRHGLTTASTSVRTSTSSRAFLDAHIVWTLSSSSGMIGRPSKQARNSKCGIDARKLSIHRLQTPRPLSSLCTTTRLGGLLWTLDPEHHSDRRK